MKKALSFVMAILMIAMTLVSCNNASSDTPDATTVTDAPTTTQAPSVTTSSTTEPEPEPEPFYANEIIKDNASQYVIVHDGTNDTMFFANAIRSSMSRAFGVTLKVVKAADKAESDYEIVLGNARAISKNTSDKLVGLYDFAMKSEDKKIVLCAKDSVSYLYFSEYLAKEVFVKSEENTLVIDSDDDLVYSDSALAEKNYIEYIGNKSFSLSDLCAKETYKNSDTTLPYRIYIPFNYNPENEYPIFVNLHGAGHRGNDNEKHLGFVTTMLTVSDIPLSDSIIIFPQCPVDNKWVDTDWGKGSYSLDAVPESNELRALVELIEKIKSEYSVDEKRIYACGLSMGGYGVWNLLMRHPDLFAGGIAMCAAADPSKASVLVDMPIWAIHGAKDPTVPVDGSREIVNAIKAAGGTKIEYTELPNNQHDVWTYTYANANIFRWLYSQVKD